MSTASNAANLPAEAPAPHHSPLQAKLSKGPGRYAMIGFSVVLVIGVLYAASQLVHDLSFVRTSSIFPFLFLGIALVIALGFEFVNGFHDTANAVATVIYTHSLDPHIAVVWSGMWNFIGVLVSSGAVAFGIISLLPVELILQVGSGAGFAMVFALLTAAIIWNLGTWWFGLPSSSSHTLIGSIIGVGLANQLLLPRTGASAASTGRRPATSASRCSSRRSSASSAAGLLAHRHEEARAATSASTKRPKAPTPPPFWIRGLLLLTCTGVSFAHGSNDGQKGMGLIMLILIGTVPTAYALNHAVTPQHSQDFVAVSDAGRRRPRPLHHDADGADADRRGAPDGHRVRAHASAGAGDAAGAARDDARHRPPHGELQDAAQRPGRGHAQLPQRHVPRQSKSLRLMEKTHQPTISAEDDAVLKNYKKHLDEATKFIPLWVKVAVAMALGLGTMVGWKRIVVTVGEKIGKDHLTYAQGAAAEITAMVTIGAADDFGLPVSTTHVLSSGVAGTMAANRSGLQWGTVRNLLMAWVLTLPVSILLAGFLFWAFSHIGG